MTLCGTVRTEFYILRYRLAEAELSAEQKPKVSKPNIMKRIF